MPLLLSTALRRWLLASVALPLAAGGARRLARTIEARRGGPNTVTRGLTKAANTAHRSTKEAAADLEREQPRSTKRRGLSGRGR